MGSDEITTPGIVRSPSLRGSCALIVSAISTSYAMLNGFLAQSAARAEDFDFASRTHRPYLLSDKSLHLVPRYKVKRQLAWSTSVRLTFCSPRAVDRRRA